MRIFPSLKREREKREKKTDKNEYSMKLLIAFFSGKFE